MPIKDICVRESYKDRDGNEKTSWNKIGILIDKGEKAYIKLFHMPGVLASVFDQKDKGNMSQPSAAQKDVQEIDVDSQNEPF